MLYFTISGTVYWTEKTLWDADFLILSGDDTLVLKIGNEGFTAQKLSKLFGRPVHITMPTSAILAIQKIGDDELTTKLRACLAGIILPEGNPTN